MCYYWRMFRYYSLYLVIGVCQGMDSTTAQMQNETETE